MSEDEKDGKSDKSDKSKKPLFFMRLFAYIIDTFIVLMVSSLLVVPFVDSKSMTETMNEAIDVMTKYQKSEIDEQEYTVELSNVNYKMARASLLVTIMNIFVSVIFFVVVPLYRKGQTIGKKLMKLKITSIDGELTANQLIFRSFIANAVLLNIISVLFVMFASRSVYSCCVDIFSFTQYIIMLISIVLVIVGKEGLAIHDMLVHTKVVTVK